MKTIEWSSIDLSAGIVNKLNELFPMPEPEPIDTAVTYLGKEDDKYYFRRSDGSEFTMEVNADLPLIVGAKYEIGATRNTALDTPITQSVVINFEIIPPTDNLLIVQ